MLIKNRFVLLLIELTMNTLVLFLEGVLIVGCLLQNAGCFTPWIKPQGDMSSISNRHVQIKVSFAVYLLFEFSPENP